MATFSVLTVLFPHPPQNPPVEVDDEGVVTGGKVTLLSLGRPIYDENAPSVTDFSMLGWLGLDL